MNIELFFDNFGRIVGYRKNRNKYGKVPKNIFKIENKEEKNLIHTLSHYCVLGTKEIYDFCSGNLYLCVI